MGDFNICHKFYPNGWWWQEEQTDGDEFEEDGIDSEQLRFGPRFLAFRFDSRQRAQVLYSDEAQGQRQREQEVETIVDKKVVPSQTTEG